MKNQLYPLNHLYDKVKYPQDIYRYNADSYEYLIHSSFAFIPAWDNINEHIIGKFTKKNITNFFLYNLLCFNSTNKVLGTSYGVDFFKFPPTDDIKDGSVFVAADDKESPENYIFPKVFSFYNEYGSIISDLE